MRLTQATCRNFRLTVRQDGPREWVFFPTYAMRRVPESEEIYERIGRNVAKRRRAFPLSQTELAKRCGLARGSIANIESGKQRATLHTLSNIAEALDVDMLSLLALPEGNAGDEENAAGGTRFSGGLAGGAGAAAGAAAGLASAGRLGGVGLALGLAGGVGAAAAGAVLGGVAVRTLIQRIQSSSSPKDDEKSSPISNEKLKKLEKQAENLVRKAGITKIPVPVEAVAKYLNIKVDEADLGEDCSGILIRDGDSAVIGVHADHHEHRQRFTIAHEIAHYKLHRGEAYIEHLHIDLRAKDFGSGTQQEEDEANRFAGALLMPADQVRKAFAEQRVDPSRDDEIPEMAKRFKVSVQAMTKRLMHLDLISAD